MKKLIAVILTGIMIFSLTACAKTKADNGGKAEAKITDTFDFAAA